MPDPVSDILAALTAPVAVFTDFDGTLVDIAPRPDAVEVGDGLLENLDGLSQALDGAFAIVTGRMIAEIDHFLSPAQYAISGSHGAERRLGDETAQPDHHLALQAATIAERAQEAFADFEGILVEAKPGGVAVHYRAAPEHEAEVRRVLARALQESEDFSLVDGKMVLEARAEGVDKGAAITLLMKEEPFRGRMPVFLGDDVSDEDGFEAVQALGGVGIKIGDGTTAARFRLPDVAAARAFLSAVSTEHAATGRAAPSPTRRG